MSTVPTTVSSSRTFVALPPGWSLGTVPASFKSQRLQNKFQETERTSGVKMIHQWLKHKAMGLPEILCWSRSSWLPLTFAWRTPASVWNCVVSSFSNGYHRLPKKSKSVRKAPTLGATSVAKRALWRSLSDE